MLVTMPVLDVFDESLVRVARSYAGTAVGGPCELASWVPGLRLDLVLDRGVEGRVWRARALTARRSRTGIRTGLGIGIGTVAWQGTAEVWLEAWHDSTIVHSYVRLDPVTAAGDPVAVAPREVDRLHALLVDRIRWRTQQWRRAVEGDSRQG